MSMLNHFKLFLVMPYNDLAIKVCIGLLPQDGE